MPKSSLVHTPPYYVVHTTESVNTLVKSAKYSDKNPGFLVYGPMILYGETKVEGQWRPMTDFSIAYATKLLLNKKVQ